MNDSAQVQERQHKRNIRHNHKVERKMQDGMNESEAYARATKRALIGPFLSIMFCMIPFLLSEKTIEVIYRWLLENNAPRINYYTRLLSISYDDWRSRISSIYILFLLSPLVLASAWYFAVVVIDKNRRQFISKSLTSKLVRVVLTLILLIVVAIAWIQVPGMDMTITKRIPNTLGIKSSLFSVAGLWSLGVIFTLLMCEFFDLNEGNT